MRFYHRENFTTNFIKALAPLCIFSASSDLKKVNRHTTREKVWTNKANPDVSYDTLAKKSCTKGCYTSVLLCLNPISHSNCIVCQIGAKIAKIANICLL